MMNNDLMIFEGNKVEVLELNGVALFNPYDVGKCLDLSDSAVRMAINQMNTNQVVKLTNSKVNSVDFRKLHNTGENFLTESGVYKLVFKSRKPNAEKFTDWVTDVVLPTIRKTGQFNSKPKKERLSSINNAARTILPVLERAGMKPEFQVYMLKQLYDKAGVDIPVERFKVEERFFDKSSIAERLGLFSSSGRPHAQAMGAIIKKLDISDDERELTSFECNGHVGTEYQYSESVIGKVQSWLEVNDFPVCIPSDNRSFRVSYASSLEVVK